MLIRSAQTRLLPPDFRLPTFILEPTVPDLRAITIHIEFSVQGIPANPYDHSIALCICLLTIATPIRAEFDLLSAHTFLGYAIAASLRLPFLPHMSNTPM